MTNNQLTENSVTQLLNNVRLARDNAERDDNRVDHSFYYALARALEELQERRKADIAPAGYFAFDSDGGFTNHDTAESARKEAQEAIDYFRGDACDGWPGDVSSVCWGVIMQQSTKTGERPVEEDDKCSSHIERVCDYVLLPELQEKPE